MTQCADDEPGDPPPQLHLAGDPGDRRARRRLVRRRPRRHAAAPGRRHPAGRPHDRRRRGLRRDDDRSRLPAGDVAGAGDGRAVPAAPARSSTRSWCEQFAEFHAGRPRRVCSGRWPAAGCATSIRAVNSYWDFNCVRSPPAAAGHRRSLFQAKLLDNMYDAVVFIDADGPIMLWNHGAERLTGIAGATVRQQHVAPRDARAVRREGRSRSATADAPCSRAIQSGVQSLRRLTICGRKRRRVAVDSHAIPVIGRDGAIAGGHPAAARRLLGNLAGAALPKPARKGHPRPADPSRQPRRVRPRTRDVRRRPPAAEGPLQPDDVRPGPLQAGQRHLRAPGGRRGDQEPGHAAERRLPARRPGGPLRRRGVRHALADCDNAAAARRAEQIRKALGQMPQPKMERPHGHGQLRRDRNPARRHARKPCSAARTGPC